MGIAERVRRIQQEERGRAEKEAQAKRAEQQAKENEIKLKEERARAFAEKIGLGRMMKDINSLLPGRSLLTGGGSFFRLEWGRRFDSYINANTYETGVRINGEDAGNTQDSIEEALARAFLNPGSKMKDEEARDAASMSRWP